MASMCITTTTTTTTSISYDSQTCFSAWPIQVLTVMNIMEVMCNDTKVFWRANFTCDNRYNAADVGESTVVHIISVGQTTRDQGALQ